MLRAGAHIQIFRYKYRTRTPIQIIYSNVRLYYEFSTVPTFARSVKTSLLWPGAVETVPDIDIDIDIFGVIVNSYNMVSIA